MSKKSNNQKFFTLLELKILANDPQNPFYPLAKKKFSEALQEIQKQIQQDASSIQIPISASLADFSKELLPFFVILKKLSAAIEEAEKEAEDLMHIVKNPNITAGEILRMPKVKMMTVIALAEKMDSFANTNAARILKEVEKLKKGLDIGRVAGVIERKTKAQENLVRINDALDSLYQNGEGWRMSNKKLAVFLMDRKISPFTYDTTLAKIKSLVPAIKAKYKSGL